MRKTLSFLIMLFLALALFGCDSAAGQSNADSDSPVVMELASPIADATNLPSEEPTASPVPEAEPSPEPIEANDDSADYWGGNYASAIPIMAYGDKLYYIGETGDSGAGKAPQNIWEINRDGSDRRSVLDEEILVNGVTEQSGYPYARPVSVYKVENDRIYFIVNVSDSEFYDVYRVHTMFPPTAWIDSEEFNLKATEDTEKYELFSVGLQGEDMRLEAEDAAEYTDGASYSKPLGGSTYIFSFRQIIQKTESGSEEVIYQNDACALVGMAVQGDWVYILEEQRSDYELCDILRVNRKTLEKQTILELPRDPGFFVRRINVLDQWVYFTDNNSMLCRVPIEGGAAESILEGAIFDFALFDHTIFYYSATVEQPEGYQIGIDYSTLLRRADLDGANDMPIDVLIETSALG